MKRMISILLLAAMLAGTAVSCSEKPAEEGAPASVSDTPAAADQNQPAPEEEETELTDEYSEDGLLGRYSPSEIYALYPEAGAYIASQLRELSDSIDLTRRAASFFPSRFFAPRISA